jgi:hypothetical protein
MCIAAEQLCNAMHAANESSSTVASASPHPNNSMGDEIFTFDIQQLVSNETSSQIDQYLSDPLRQLTVLDNFPVI